jgi:hypothetical protein
MKVNYAIAQKVVLYVGTMVAVLLTIFPHWQVPVSVEAQGETRTVYRDIGRELIWVQFLQLTGRDAKLVPSINRVRLYTEVGAALSLTFVLMFALDRKKSTGDRKNDAEE